MSKPNTRIANRSSEIIEHQRALLDLLPAATIVTRYDGTIIYANQRVKNEFGVELGQNIRDFYQNPAFRDDLLKVFRETGHIDNLEMRARKADGTSVWILISARQFEFEDGEAILSSLVDITDHKRAEEALRISEEKFRDIFMVSLDGIYISKPEGRGKLIDVNETFAQITGYSRDELIGQSALDLGIFYDPADRERLLANVREHGFCKELELKIRKKSGEIIFCTLSGQPIDLGGEKYLMGVIRDVDTRKKVEEELMMLKYSIDNHFDSAYWLGADSKFVYINDAGCKALGYQRDELIGKPFNTVSPSATSEAMDEVWEQLRRDGYFYSMEAVQRRKDGSEFPVDIIVTYVNFEGREYACGFARDITERKRAQTELQHSRANLSTLIESTDDLIWSVDAKYRLVTYNKAFEQHFLRNYGTHAVIGALPEDILPPERAAQWPELYKHVVDTGPSRLDYTLPDGRILELSLNPILQNGKVVGVSAFGKDITPRKRAEENLVQQAERLQILHTVERAITSSLELEYILELLAREVISLLHVDACSVLLLNPDTHQLEFMTKQGFHTQALQFTRLKVGVGLAGQAAYERRIVYISNLQEIGEENPSLVKAIRDEKFISYFGIPLVIKDQVLGVMEIFHRSTLGPDPEWLKFLNTLADQAANSINNARLLEMTQQSLKEANALYRINQDLIAAADANFLMKNVVNLLQENFRYYYVQVFVADPATGNFVLRAGSGEIGQKLQAEGYFLSPGEGIVGFTAETGKAFFTNDVDQVISSVKIPYLAETKSELAVPIKVGEHMLGLLDVHQCPPAVLTERDLQLVSVVADQLAVAHQKAQMYAELQKALKHEQATRNALIQAEKLTLAGRLLASVSHELNNPIQAIQNALFLLKEEKGISSQGRQDLEIVLSETERMATLLERLRATYQPASQQEFRLQQVNDLIADTCALVATHLRHRGISYVFFDDPNVPPIPVVANQLRQVFLNLIMNAADAMSKGGRLTLSTQLLPEADEILIKIADTGTGIDENIFPNIFEAFVTNKERGTGLGLAISYEIILKHEGRIKAENNPDEGATVSIWLPISVGGER